MKKTPREELKSLNRRYRRQAAIAEINLAINQPRELRAVLDRIAGVITDLLPASGGASVILWDADKKHFFVSASTVPGQKAQLASRRVRQKKGATRWIVENKRPLVVTDIRRDPFGANRMLREFGMKAYAGVPIIFKGKPLGVMYALDRRARKYTREDIDFMTALADRAALAIDKVRLYEELVAVNRLLARAKNEWERTFDAIPDLILLLSRGKRILRINRVMADKLGFAPRECVGRHCYEIVHGTSAPPPNCPHARALRDGKMHTQELHEKRLGGDFIVQVSPMCDNEGRLLGFVHVAHDITERKRAERADQLRRFSEMLISVQEADKKHTARELHDGIGQTLTAIKLSLAMMLKDNTRLGEREEQRVGRAIGMVEHAIRDVRRISAKLRPEILDELGLLPSIEQDLRFLSETSGIRMRLVCRGIKERLDPSSEIAVYRVIQEALNNIVRHSRAREAEVRIAQRGRGLHIEITDDGRGIPSAAIKKPRGLGLLSMRERISAAGGTFAVLSRPGKGARLEMMVPFRSNAGKRRATART